MGKEFSICKSHFSICNRQQRDATPANHGTPPPLSTQTFATAFGLSPPYSVGGLSCSPLAKAGSGTRREIWLRGLSRVLLIAAIGCMVLIASGFARADDQEPLWDPNGVEDFSLTECHGQTVTKADLLGKPWVACFIFTRCAGPCPRVSEQMQIGRAHV